MRRVIPWVVVLFALQVRAGEDPILKAMLEELARESKGLVLEGYEKPYFISYLVRDVQKVFVSGAFGALFSSGGGHSRSLYVDCRVGNYKLDSSLADSAFDFSDFEDKVYIPTRQVPIDDDPYAIKRVIWLRSDYKYKRALKLYLKMKAKLVTEADSKRPPAFSREKPFQLTEPVKPFKVNRKRYEHIVRELGKVLLEFPQIFDSIVTMSATQVIRYIVNTEGTIVRTVDRYYGVAVNFVTRAKDGMRLNDYVVVYYRDKDQGPSLKELKRRLRKEARTLLDIAKAPVLDPATVPAILMPEAAGVFFHETLGHRLEGQRQRKSDEGKTFRNYIGKRIMPDFLNVYDDPTMKEFNGVPLNGYYRVDDEGVPAQRVVLVQKGVLKNFLMSRTPVKGFDHSNGHGRSNGVLKPVARMGNLIVEATRTVSMERLKEMLIEEVKRQHKPFGVIIKRVTGGSTNTSTYGYQAFKDTPIVMYKVDPETGKEELVRGVEIVGTPLVSLGNIIAAGDAYGVFNGYCGAESGMVPVSAVAPALLFKEVELQRTSQPKDRAPVLAPPALGK